MGLLGDIGGAIIGGIAGTAQQKIAADTARKNTEMTIAANKNLAEYQYSKDVEMWNAGNAYNAPAAQMERLKAGGLNPNLVYGNGATGNTASNLPKYQAPTVKYDYLPEVSPLSMLSQFQDVQLKQAQIDNLKANEDNTRAGIVIRTLDAKDKAAKNWFNFGNKDMSKWEPRNEFYNYTNKLRLGEAQADVAKALVNDQILKLRISNEKSGVDIAGKRIENELKQKNVDWYGANMALKALGVAGAGAVAGSFLKKVPKYQYRPSVSKPASGNSRWPSASINDYYEQVRKSGK